MVWGMQQVPTQVVVNWVDSNLLAWGRLEQRKQIT